MLAAVAMANMQKRRALWTTAKTLARAEKHAERMQLWRERIDAKMRAMLRLASAATTKHATLGAGEPVRM